jgi:predicted nucleic acid-binding protein
LIAYADTSFLVSLYITDANSERATRIAEKLAPPWFVVTEFGEFELVNALWLRIFRRELSATAAGEAQSIFELHLRDGLMSQRLMTSEIYFRARDLAMRWSYSLGTRALDVLHVASALVLEADMFHTFDERQAKLARAVGLRIP